MRIRRTDAALRLVASAVAVLLLSSQLAAVAHLIAVDHVRCEHGELIEVGRAVHSVVTAPAAQKTIIASSSPARSGHEHCLLGPMRRDRAAGANHGSGSQAAPEAQRSQLDHDDSFVAAPIPLILLAPKSSPPAAV